MIDLKVPPVGESITEVTLIKWIKGNGNYVNRDEALCEFESEKATFELNAEKAGILSIIAKEGDVLQIGDVACRIDETAIKQGETETIKTSPSIEKQDLPVINVAEQEVKATPVAQAIMAEKHLNPIEINGSGSLGKILKNDVLNAVVEIEKTDDKKNATTENPNRKSRNENMSNLRKTISRRLVEAKNTTAMLTTFNEVDMTAILEIRKQYKDKFKEVNGIGLGFMSFFVKACCTALLEWKSVNAYLDGETIIYHEYCDISVAVSAPKGLVVPVIRNAETLAMHEIEQKVAELAKKARENKLSPDEMSGGTFTITNGGVFGSLMSTPIINIPQSAILGMHKIQERPIVINGKIEIRQMMYVALSYDHRIIDGRESVSFLVRIKELIENPTYLLFGEDPVIKLLGL